MRRVLSLSLALGALLAPLRASATDVPTCLGASEKGQRARAAGKLREARDQFLVCGGEGCPAIVRRDCSQWQAEIVGLLPSVVFGAKDKGGRDLFDVTVSMDGEVLQKKLDGKSINVDPGPHTFKFEIAGQPPVVERALVKEGEKTRAIAVTFGDGITTTSTEGAAPVPVVEPDKGKPPPNIEQGHTIFPWLVVGAGAATVIAGVIVFATSPDLPDSCNRTTQTCAPIPGESAQSFSARQERAGRSDAQPTEGLVIGAIGLAVVAGGLLWHFLEPTGPRTGSLRFTPWAAPGGAGSAAGGVLGGSF